MPESCLSTINLSTNQLIDQAINRSSNQKINPSIEQSNNQE